MLFTPKYLKTPKQEPLKKLKIKNIMSRPTFDPQAKQDEGPRILLPQPAMQMQNNTLTATTTFLFLFCFISSTIYEASTQTRICSAICFRRAVNMTHTHTGQCFPWLALKWKDFISVCVCVCVLLPSFSLFTPFLQLLSRLLPVGFPYFRPPLCAFCQIQSGFLIAHIQRTCFLALHPSCPIARWQTSQMGILSSCASCIAGLFHWPTSVG